MFYLFIKIIFKNPCFLVSSYSCYFCFGFFFCLFVVFCYSCFLITHGQNTHERKQNCERTKLCKFSITLYLDQSINEIPKLLTLTLYWWSHTSTLSFSYKTYYWHIAPQYWFHAQIRVYLLSEDVGTTSIGCQIPFWL